MLVSYVSLVVGCMCAADGFNMSGVNASGTSDDTTVTPNFVAFSVPSNSSAMMEPGFDAASASTYVQHGSQNVLFYQLIPTVTFNYLYHGRYLLPTFVCDCHFTAALAEACSLSPCFVLLVFLTFFFLKLSLPSWSGDKKGTQPVKILH